MHKSTIKKGQREEKAGRQDSRKFRTKNRDCPAKTGTVGEYRTLDLGNQYGKVWLISACAYHSQ